MRAPGKRAGYRASHVAGKNHQTRVFARRVIWARAAFFRTPVNDSLMNILVVEIEIEEMYMFISLVSPTY